MVEAYGGGGNEADVTAFQQFLVAVSAGTYNPVSYTHLDVYKRQHLCRILLRLLLGITGAGTCRYPFDADFGVEHRIVSVSYTHLDVYKRQALRCSAVLNRRAFLYPSFISISSTPAFVAKRSFLKNSCAVMGSND